MLDRAHGSIRDASILALQHGLIEVPGTATLVGVVRRPTLGFSATVDENATALGLPPALLDEFQHRVEDLKMRGLCEEGAHNSAWTEVDVEGRYYDYLDSSSAARSSFDALTERVRAGETVVLVCDATTAKTRSHRTLLRDRLEARV